MTEKSPLTSTPSSNGKEEAASNNIEELRSRDQERRAQKKEKAKQRREEREKKRKAVSLEELRERLPEAPLRGNVEEERKEEPKESKPWEIEALEGARKDLEKEKREREEETERLTKEAEERDRREKAELAESREEKDEKKEKWPSSVARAVDEGYNRFEKAKHDNAELKRLHVGVEQAIETYQREIQHEWSPLPEEESRLLQLKRDIENQLESMTEKAPPLPPSGEEVHEVEPREEPQTREERIAAFRVRREELAKKHEKEGWQSQEEYAGSLTEHYDRGTAEHYNFDTKKINEAIEEAKKEKNPRYGKQSIERLQRAKALIDREIGGEERKKGQQEAEQMPQGARAGQAQTEAWQAPPPSEPQEEPQIPPLDSGQTEQWSYPEEKKEESPASPELQRGEPEMRREIDALLGEELGKDAQMREAAAAVIEARRAMSNALSTRKEERLYAEAGAGFIAPERLQEAEQIEKAYEDALVGLSARLRESAGNNAEAFLVPYLNIQNAEAMRIAQMREAALTPERRSIAVRFYQRLNNPFNSDVPPKWARYVRVGLTAAVLGGGAAALGGAGALGIASLAGWRMGRSFAYMAANGIARGGIDMALTRHADAMMGEESGRQRAAMQEALKNNERVEALRESMRASIRGFQTEAAAQLENRKFYGRAATFGLMGLSGLISYELARPSAVAADEGPFGAHVATNEDVLRQRFGEAWGRFARGAKELEESAEGKAGGAWATTKGFMGGITERAEELGKTGLSYGEAMTKALGEAAAKIESYISGGKPSSEVVEDVIRKGGASGVVIEEVQGKLEAAAKAAEKAAADAEAAGKIAPMGPKFPPEGGVTPPEGEPPSSIGGGHPSPEDIKRYYNSPYAPVGEVSPEAGTPFTPEAPNAAIEKGIFSSEQIENAKKAWEGKLEAVGKEPIATIGKGGNIWEASRSLIGEGEGKISKEQWLEAWEKSGLADKGFVKHGAQVRFDVTDGLLKVSEAKDNAFLYQALVTEGKIKVGEPVPPQYQWLEKWHDAKEGHPSVADVVKESADRALARPAAPPLHEVLETPVAGAQGGTFEQLLQNKSVQASYADTFGRSNFVEQTELLEVVKNGAKRLEENSGGAHASMGAAYTQEVADIKSFINLLENNTGYQGHLRAYEALVKEWGRKVGVSEEQFAELTNKSVEQFLTMAKKIENHDFVPSDPLSKVLEARRLGTLEMAEEIRSKLPDRGALKMSLGRFLKNTL